MADESPKSEEVGTPVDPMRLLIAFGRRRWILGGTGVFGIIAGVALAKAVVPPVFEARSIIECDRCSGSDAGDRELATLQESVELPHHLEKARQQLGIKSPIEQIGRDIDVGASIESRLIQVTARAKNAGLAAGLANVIVEAFMETRLQVEREKLADRLQTLEFDTQKSRKAVNDAREQYDDFRTKNNIADLPAERQAAILESARLRSEAALAHGEQEAEQARAKAWRRASSKEPSTKLLSTLEDLPNAKRLSIAKSELVSASSRFSKDHPHILALSAEVETLERKLAISNDAVATVQTFGPNPQWELARQGLMQANAGHEAASIRQSTYEKLAESAAQAAARLSGIEGRASELLSNLQNAEKHYVTIELDRKLAEYAASTPSTGLRILATARTPSNPIQSSRKIAILLGPIVGCIIVALVIALHELRGLRIHTANELTFWGRGPVLTASQWPRKPEALRDLESDIVGALHGTKGKTLLLGVGSTELTLVQPVARSIREQIESRPESIHYGSIATFEQLESIAALRHAVRNADRVIILVEAGRHSAWALRNFVQKMGQPRHIAFVLVGLNENHASLPDLVGDIAEFRNSTAIPEVNVPRQSPPIEDGRPRLQPAPARRLGENNETIPPSHVEGRRRVHRSSRIMTRQWAFARAPMRTWSNQGRRDK